MKVTKNLTEGNIYKNYLLYAIPLILSSLLSSAYSTIDAVIAGKFISEHALGAISATSSYDVLFNAFFNGFSGGFSIYISQLFGIGDRASIKRDAVHMTLFVAVVSVVISALSILFRAPIIGYLNVDPVIREDAEIYFILYTSGYVFSFVNKILMKTLYALGVTSFSIYVSLASAILNIVGNLFAVLVLDMGVAGLACSTILSVFAATVFYLYMLKKAFGELECEKVNYRFRLSCVTRTIRYTLPVAVQKVAFHATGIFIAPAINGLGADATTGYSVMNRMYNICAQSFWNTCSAVDCYTAQCVGMGDHRKLKRGLLAGVWMNIAILSPFVLIFLLFAEPIASIFFTAGYVGPAMEYSVRFFKVFSPFLYINMAGHLMHSYMRSIGRVGTVLWVTIIGSVVRILATLLLVPTFKMDGVYIGMVLSWLVDGAISVAMYFAFYHKEHHIKGLVERFHYKA